MMMEHVPVPLDKPKRKKKAPPTETKALSQDLYIENLGNKIEKSDIQDKEALTMRIVDRIGEIEKQREMYKAQFEDAANHAERVRVVEHMLDLDQDRLKLREIFDKIIRPTREEMMNGDQPLTQDERDLIEAQTPYLLVGGRRGEKTKVVPVSEGLRAESMFDEEMEAAMVSEDSPEDRYKWLGDMYDKFSEALRKLELSAQGNPARKEELVPVLKRLKLRQKLLMMEMSEIRRADLEPPRFEKAS